MPQVNTVPVAEPWLGSKERLLLRECVNSGWVSSQGRFVSKFEKLFSSYCGVKYGLATSSGTSALHLALAALDIGPGDEVIVPALSFIATANSVVYVGATPKFVDSTRETWNLDPVAVERAVTRRTRAIVAVHNYGHPAEMDEVLAIAKKHHLDVIEDSCEAHGAEYRGRKVGSLGTVGCFSFYGNKIITTGEGGMLVTNDRSLMETAAMLRDHGMSRRKKYWHPRIGFNYRMTNLQAALGVAQLDRIERVISLKRRNAELYNSLLKGTDGIMPPPEMARVKSVFWLYTVLVKDSFKVSRNTLLRELGRRGFEARPAFSVISNMPPYRNGAQQKFPVAERIARTGLSLPSSPLLKAADIHRICSVIKGLSNRK